MDNYYVKITVEDINIAENFFQNDKHLDEFISNVSRYYCKKPLTLKTKIVKRYFETYKKVMDKVIVNREVGKKGGLKRIENERIKENSLEPPLQPPLEPLVEANLNKVNKVKEVNKVNNIEERKLKFADTLKPFIDKFGRTMVNDFYRYWTQPNNSNTKFKRELEKTWDLSLRLDTWARNDKSTFGKTTEQKLEPKLNMLK